MYNIFYNSIFFIVSLYFTIKSISYGIYELKNENNKTGGITVISFSILVAIFANAIIWTR